MEFSESIKALGEKALSQRDLLQTEESTKNALIMPFIVALGYDVFNPMEVVPEYAADVGMKKGEKVDYALMADSAPQILIECKRADAALQEEDKSQLHRYFSTLTDVHFGILTNGIVYRLFSDIESENVMDSDPFLEIDLGQIQDLSIENLRSFTKGRFNQKSAIQEATNLKYMRQVKETLKEEWKNPSPDFVRCCIKGVHAGPKTANVIDRFTGIVQQAMSQLIGDEVNYRLKVVFEGQPSGDKEDPLSKWLGDDNVVGEQHMAPKDATEEGDPPMATTKQDRVVTTEEEILAVDLVREVLAAEVDPERVGMRDHLSYCAVLLDNNNRKAICRLYLDKTLMQIGFMSKERDERGRQIEEKITIGSVEDIRNHGERLLASLRLVA